MMKQKTLKKLLVVLTIVTLVPVAQVTIVWAEGYIMKAIISKDLLIARRIPTGFDTYTLFLFCGHEWNREEKKKDVQVFFNDFVNFADSIRKDNMAVWFWEDIKNLKIDVKRCQNYCDAFDLDPNGSPYLFVTSFYPITKNEISDIESEIDKLGYFYLRTLRNRLENTPKRNRLYELEMIKHEEPLASFLKLPVLLETTIVTIESPKEPSLRHLRGGLIFPEGKPLPIQQYIPKPNVIKIYISILKETYTRQDESKLFYVSLGHIDAERRVHVLNVLEQNIRKKIEFGEGITYEKIKQIFNTYFKQIKEEIISVIEVVVPIMKK